MAYAFGNPKHVPPGRTRDLPLVAEQTAVLIIDVQRYCSVPNHGCHVGVSRDSLGYFFDRVDAMIQSLGPLLEQARSQGTEVIYTFIEALTSDGRDASLDYKLSGPLLVPRGSPDAEILPGIKPLPSDILIPKTSCSVFNSTNLHYVLGNLGIRQLAICGQLTNQCVESAVRDAADLGYLVTVLEDACAAKSGEDHEKGLSGMRGFARFVCCQKALQELSDSKRTCERRVSQSEFSASVVSPQPVLGSTSLMRVPDTTVATALGAMLKALCIADVKFLRICVVDVSGQARAKALVLDNIMRKPSAILDGVGMVECLMAFPVQGDMVSPNSGLSPTGMLALRPDLDTLQVLPYNPTHARVFGYLHNTDGSLSPFCPRGLLWRVCQKAADADGCNFRIVVGVEIEFSLRKHGKAVDNFNWAASCALDEQANFLEELSDWLKKQSIIIELVHAESMSGQFEIVLAHGEPISIADKVVASRETIAACAKKHGMEVTFLPKVFPDAAGNGMHVHMSISRQGKNIFPDASQAFGISCTGNAFMAGLLEHLPALMAVTTPTNNSFRRVVAGCWAGAFQCWGMENKEAAIRVCQEQAHVAPCHFELKTMDATCNIYLALALVIASGLDGVQKEMKLPPPVNYNPGLGRREGEDNSPAPLPTSLLASLAKLEADTCLMDTLGERMARSYFAVKKCEESYFRNTDLQAEVEILSSKGL